VNLRIEPEPSEEEREAILRALAEERDPSPDPYASPWRRAGLRDELEELGEEP
jgi:hypothetical protein